MKFNIFKYFLTNENETSFLVLPTHTNSLAHSITFPWISQLFNFASNYSFLFVVPRKSTCLWEKSIFCWCFILTCLPTQQTRKTTKHPVSSTLWHEVKVMKYSSRYRAPPFSKLSSTFNFPFLLNKKMFFADVVFFTVLCNREESKEKYYFPLTIPTQKNVGAKAQQQEKQVESGESFNYL